MKLTALELMDLSDKLDELMSKAATASGLDLLDISDEIDQVMQQMGYGAATGANPEELPPTDNVPQLVADFLADKFLKQSSDDFVGVLQDLSQYVGTYIDLEQVKQHTASWIDANVKEAA
ncbi:ddrA [Salmonella enterica]|nr:ddrA [Salmonella enterica]EHK5999315.1 ddrA [Salmonella enterica]EIF5124534.1 ddrA [Salmonella enterica]EIF5348710.1 ddrA [Salmonella enterica]EIF5657307.1 ddrA [Salmonella enterica]